MELSESDPARIRRKTADVLDDPLLSAREAATERGQALLKIDYVSPLALTPAPDNPRVHSPQQVQAIARSVETFGFNVPLLVDRNHKVIAGHGRLEAAKLLRLAKVPIICQEHLTDAQVKAYRLADNRLAERSTWDERGLALALQELQEMALEFDLEVIGFDAPEIDMRIQALDSPDEADAADAFEEPEEIAVSTHGDLWFLGSHRLLCGNALDAAVYASLAGDEQATAIFTDPPYNVRINGHVTGNGRVRHREFAMASGEMDCHEFTSFLRIWVELARPHMTEAGVIFTCMDWRHLLETITALTQAGDELINLCVWVKSNGGMGSLYRSRHELVLVSRPNGARHQNNVQLGAYGRNRTNVWHYPGMNSFAGRARTHGANAHPTVKPIRMVADAILDVTSRGDIILDPFCGSGTTLLAAERTGRRGYGIELDPLYIDLTIRRWQTMTKQVAKHADGRSFAEVEAERTAMPDTA